MEPRLGSGHCNFPVWSVQVWRKGHVRPHPAQSGSSLLRLRGGPKLSSVGCPMALASKSQSLAAFSCMAECNMLLATGPLALGAGGLSQCFSYTYSKDTACAMDVMDAMDVRDVMDVTMARTFHEVAPLAES